MVNALKASGARNAQSWNGGLGREQIRWLESRLKAADRAGERVIVFCHFPVFPEDAHNLWNHQEAVNVLSSHKSTVAYLAGHNHAGHYAQKDGIHFLTVQGMVDTADQTAYAVAEVYPDRIEICGVGRVPNRTLRFSQR
jgi:hypothetical protein